jgi:hypothetical protein
MCHGPAADPASFDPPMSDAAKTAYRIVVSGENLLGPNEYKFIIDPAGHHYSTIITGAWAEITHTTHGAISTQNQMKKTDGSDIWINFDANGHGWFSATNAG